MNRSRNTNKKFLLLKSRRGLQKPKLKNQQRWCRECFRSWEMETCNSKIFKCDSQKNFGICEGGNDQDSQSFRKKFLTLEEIEDFLKKLEEQFPQKIKVESIGNSRNGRSIWMARISDKDLCKDPESAIMVEAGSCGCDLHSVASALNIIDVATKGRGFAKNMDIFVIPCSNPDGYLTVLDDDYDDEIPISLSYNYPVWLGINDDSGISMQNFLSAIERWREAYHFNMPETTALINVVALYESCIKLFISLQEEGEKIVYPQGCSDKPVANVNNFVKVAKTGQSAIKSRCFEFGSIYQFFGLKYGCFIDYLPYCQNSIELRFVFHINNRRKTKPVPENIAKFSDDVTNAIKGMARAVSNLTNKDDKGKRCYEYLD